MKALAKLERAPGLTLTRVKKPEVGHNDVLIRIRKTAICGFVDFAGGMRRAHLRSDSRLALRHHRIREPDHVDPFD